MAAVTGMTGMTSDSFRPHRLRLSSSHQKGGVSVPEEAHGGRTRNPPKQRHAREYETDANDATDDRNWRPGADDRGTQAAADDNGGEHALLGVKSRSALTGSYAHIGLYSSDRIASRLLEVITLSTTPGGRRASTLQTSSQSQAASEPKPKDFQSHAKNSEKKPMKKKKMKKQASGYRIIKQARKPKLKTETNQRPPRLRSSKTKPLLDHFHGLHFGIMDPADFPRRPPVQVSYSVEGTFLWAVGLFGTVENGAVLLTSIFSRKFRKPLHLLIGSLALTDLFVSLIYIPSYTYYLLEGDRMIQGSDKAKVRVFIEESAQGFCKLSRSIFVEIASVTLTLKALIAVYLYICACSRECVAQVFSMRNTCCYILLAWAINYVMLFVPTFLGYPEVDFYPNSFICSSPRQPANRGGRIAAGAETGTLGQAPPTPSPSPLVHAFLTLAVHIAELIVVCLCFVKVHLAILRGKLYSTRHRSADRQAQISYMRALKITCLVFTSFCVCWMPIYVINVLDPKHTRLPVHVHHLVMDLLLLKSSINPTIYIYGIRSLRYEIKLLCLCRCRKDSNNKGKDTLFAVGKDGGGGDGGGCGGGRESSDNEKLAGTFSSISAEVWKKSYHIPAVKKTKRGVHV